MHPATASASTPDTHQSLSPGREIPVFEFTKRKRWADLLVTELSDSIILILSASCQVWYCGSAVTDLLGWREDELVDNDLVDLMNGASPPPPGARLRPCASDLC